MILVDVNIFCDCATERYGWDNSMIILSKVRNKINKGYISSLTIVLLYFYIKKEGGFDLPIVREHTKLLIDGFEISPLTEKIITLAMKSSIEDFEDAIQFITARENDCKYIITRNIKDFPNDEGIEILTPEEFINIFGETV